MKSNKKVGWVGLQNLIIKGSVGVYEHEKKEGTNLQIDLSIFGDLVPAIESDQLDKSFNYELLEKIAQEEVLIGGHLLEPLADRILNRILEEMPLVKKAKIKLKKLNPPLKNPCEASFIKLTIKRKKIA